ncbi:hypothetical protein [Pantoea agglomerans]|uniref:hypothetical protein n=1 Tax=Enterobacter agglomerans TaxID=549 RepID=UPI001303AE23|nr:hypothetical protein [Pantoea agglomerans]
MARGKSVTIGDLTFSSKKAAVDHFMDQREQVRASGPVTEGVLFDQLADLFTRYCNVTPRYALNGRYITGFEVDYELRDNGGYVQHLCYKVKFTNHEVRPFSVNKAVSAIIEAERV